MFYCRFFIIDICENGSGTGINSRASSRKMCCPNGSKKLLRRKY